MRWSSRTWCEITSDLAHGAAMLPVGATEQHGPHLGLGMDSTLVELLTDAVSDATGVPALPLLPYGCSIGHSRRWPGTIALEPQTMIEIVGQIGEWAHAAGVRRLFIVNAHVGNAAPLRCALEVLRAAHDDLMVAVINTATMSERVRAAHEADAQDWHANEAETALMLARAPGMVREELIAGADDQDRTGGLVFAHPVNRTSRNGVTGRPSSATRAGGETLFGWMVADLADIVRRGLAERPPLEHSWNARSD